MKPAGRDLGPAIPAADLAIEKGNADSLLELLKGVVGDGVLDHFKEVMGQKSFDKNDVDRGRDYVRAYVEFIHYVERIYESTKKTSPGHFQEAEGAKIH